MEFLSSKKVNIIKFAVACTTYTMQNTNRSKHYNIFILLKKWLVTFCQLHTRNDKTTEFIKFSPLFLTARRPNIKPAVIPM